MAIVTTMMKLMLAMAAGFYLYKKGIFTKQTNSALSKLIVDITCPSLILYSISSVESGNNSVVLRLFFAGIGAYAMFIAVGWLFVRIVRVPVNLRGTYMCMLIFSNNIFMGVPVAQSLFGESAVFYITIFNMPFNFLIYSVGLQLFYNDACMEQPGMEKARFEPKKLANVGIFASALALIIYFSGIKIPNMVNSCLGFLGNITPALSMIVIGSSIAASSVSEIKEQPGLIPMLAARLALMPLVTWLYIRLFISDATLIGICTVSAAMPIASMVAMMSSSHPHQGKAASIAVAVTTIASMVTIPVVYLLMNMAA